MSLWERRASGSLKAHSLLMAASMTVKWCRATGAHEMSKNIPLRPCCWTCQVCCQLGNGLSLEEMFLEFVRTEVFIGVSKKIRQPIRVRPQLLTSALTLDHRNIYSNYFVTIELTDVFFLSLSYPHRTVQSSVTREEALSIQKPPPPLPTHQQIC